MGKVDIPVLEAFLRFTTKKERGKHFQQARNWKLLQFMFNFGRGRLLKNTCFAINAIKLNVVHSCRVHLM